MSEEFYDICRSSHIEIDITDYKILDIPTIVNKLKEFGIITKIYRNSTKNFIWRYKHIRLTEDKIDCLSKCIFKDTYSSYRNGKIYLCAHIAYIDFSITILEKNITLDETDYISLDEINSFDELIEKINLSKPNFCYKYCNYYDKTHPEKGVWHTTKKILMNFV